ALRVDPIQSLTANAPLAHQPHLPQHAQVLRHHRLGPTQPFNNLVDREFACAHRLEHLPPLGLGHGIESIIRGWLAGHSQIIFPYGNVSRGSLNSGSGPNLDNLRLDAGRVSQLPVNGEWHHRSWLLRAPAWTSVRQPDIMLQSQSAAQRPYSLLEIVSLFEV